MNDGAWVTVIAVVALLVSYWEFAAGVWIAKPLASTGFILSALQHGARGTTYGNWVLAALALSWCGDVLLIPRTRKTFTAGIGAFLLGHVAYAGAFVARGVTWPLVGMAALPLLVVLGLVGRWLLPKVEQRMKVPVLAYMGVITTMVALAVGTSSTQGIPWMLVGAVGFYLSDLSVARDRFVAPGLVNKLWGTPLYFGAQLVLAATV